MTGLELLKSKNGHNLKIITLENTVFYKHVSRCHGHPAPSPADKNIS
jgi:hypothetical protein